MRLNRRELLCAMIQAGAASLARPLRAEQSFQDVIGRPVRHEIQLGDTFADLAIRYGVGYCALAAANRGIDPWLPSPGATVVIPLQHVLPAGVREGIVINIGDMRLYHHGTHGYVQSYPIGIAADNDGIVLGRTAVVRKRVNPIWIPPDSIRLERPDLPLAVPPGASNPLGHFALDLGWPAMVIHGTNRPYGVGRRVSHGCFRLFEKDIASLFLSTPLGTAVTVTYQPVKLGWLDGGLMLEIHPDANQMTELDERGTFTPDVPTELPEILGAVLGEDLRQRIEWDIVADAAWRRSGLPIRIDRIPLLTAPRQK